MNNLSIRNKPNTIKEQVIFDMKNLSVYKAEFDAVITVFSDLLEQYYNAIEDFKNSGSQYTFETSSGQIKKNPALGTIETCRKDILSYSTVLKLNPKEYLDKVEQTGEKQQDENEERSTIDDFLRAAGNA
jgi:phage terminase small subunit